MPEVSAERQKEIINFLSTLGDKEKEMVLRRLLPTDDDLIEILPFFSEEERGNVLGHLVNREIAQRKGYIPEGAWYPMQNALRFSYFEVGIIKQKGLTLHILLTRRAPDDPHFPGQPWHIPGGLFRTDSMAEACQKIAKQELGISSLTRIERVSFYPWDDHPYGHPISLIAACETSEIIKETEDMKFFPVLFLPPMVPHHADFVRWIHRFVQLGLSERLK